MHLLQPAEVMDKVSALQAADTSGRLLAHIFSKVSGERYPEDDSEKEPARRDLAEIMVHKWRDHIPGGLAEGKKPSDFPAEDLVKGMTVEMEHTIDPAVACEIAMDHLTEKSDYYRKGDMAKEVAEALEEVDGSISLAKKAGVMIAQMNKEAFPNLLGAVKRLVRPVEGAAAKGVMGGAERSMGKVLPLHSPVSELEGAKTIASPGTLRQGPIPTANTFTDPHRGMPMQQMIEGGQAAPAAARKATRGFEQHPLVGKVEQATKMPGEPTRRMDIPAGNYNPETRRIGADEWMAAHPEQVAANKRIAAQRDELARPAAKATAAPGNLSPAPAAYDARAQHLLDTGEAMPTRAPAPASPGWAARANQDIALAKHVTPPIPTSPHTGASMGGTAGFHGGPGAVAPPPSGPASPPGSVAPPGPSVRRFSKGKALGAVGALGAGYGLYKGVPWAANQIAETSAMPLAYGGGWSPTPYGYGYSPYGSGVPTMGPGA